MEAGQDTDQNIVLDCTSCPVHDAVLTFARTAYDGLVRKVIARLQWRTASGVYGDDYHHKTLWDEYCHEVQLGPHMFLEGAWDISIEPVLDEIVPSVSSEIAALLMIAALWDLDEPDTTFTGAVDRQLIRAKFATDVGKRRGRPRYVAL
jgi:hypothetical protein